MTEIIIGRKGNQPFEISDKKVSAKHLKATMLDNGKIQIEDLESSNGTFVDGIKIIKKTVSAETIVSLGDSYQLRIGDAFVKEESIADQFKKLKAVSDNYQKAKIKIQQENARKQFLRSLPGVASSLLFALTFLLGDTVSGIKPFVGIIMIAGIAVSSIMAYKGQQEVPVKMEALNKKFMVKYVCPKCKNFLGFLPYESLKNKGYCSSCKVKWD